MTVYFTTANQLQQNAVPVTVAPWKDFSAEQWDNGYFRIKGSLHTDNAATDGDRQVIGSTIVECIKSTNTCSVATADVYSGTLNLDTTNFDIDSWDAKQIVFHDDSSICMNNSYVIDRAARSYNLIARRKPIIPDYAIKSPLHPCDNLKDRSVSLEPGGTANELEVQTFWRNNGLYLHVYLVALNAAYLALLIWLGRRRRLRQAALTSV